jgi:hypothetical protein
MHIIGKRVLRFLGTAACFAAATAGGWPQATGPVGVPLTTEEHVRSSGWWPTKNTPQREEYVGPAACTECHASEAASQETTPMAKACVRAADSKFLEKYKRLSFRLGPYVYDLSDSGSGIIFSVSNGERSISAILGWGFGEGEVGQTYVFERGGIFYESRLSYFPVLHALDFSPGHPQSQPADLERAIGLQLDPQDTHLCFGCHNTASSTGGHFDPDHLILGVTCEACHGPGLKHASAMKAGRITEGSTYVLNPAKLDPVDAVDFCGSCHRTWADVLETGMAGVRTVRFQPYRLESSRCWGNGDARITCLACHNAHQPLAHDSAFYDNACLRCHIATKGSMNTSDHPGAACPQNTKDCATCHMPKYEPPGTHTYFTDHRIRIVQADRNYPD